MKKRKLLAAVCLLAFAFGLWGPIVSAQSSCLGDITGDGQVNTSDYNILVQNFLRSPLSDTRADLTGDGRVNLSDSQLFALAFLKPCQKPTSPPTPAPSTTPSPVGTTEWTQDGHDSARTGYTAETPTGTWRLLWTWNGPDANGGTSAHTYNAYREGRTVTGGAHVYVPAMSQGLVALRKTDGKKAWSVTSTSFAATPAYDSSGFVFAGGEDGKLYKINAASGAVLGTYTAGSPIHRSILLAESSVFLISDDGKVHRINPSTMQTQWIYASGEPIGTSLAYSGSRKLILFATNALYVHAVDATNGTRRWHEKPTSAPPGFPNEFDGMWPVVADKTGIVFVRMRINHDLGLWGSPEANHFFPQTNSATRALLTSRPELQNLFALDLDTGKPKFIPAVGYGGVEDYVSGRPYIDIGPLPVIKTYGSTEVAYQQFRSGQGGQYDGRWDSHLGEMVLNDTTIPDFTAGDLRFIQTPKSMSIITDEQTPLSMAGDTLFYAHWGAAESWRITDRSSSLGLTFTNPIKTQKLPTVIRRITACGSPNASTHYTTCGLTLYNDGKYWDGPGFWVYWNTEDPPKSPSGSAYSAGILPRYTYVSDGLIVVEGNGGDLFVLTYR